jgi:hypothetical protein
MATTDGSPSRRARRSRALYQHRRPRFPRTHRINLACTYGARRLLGSGAINSSDPAFCGHVPSGLYYRRTGAYTMLSSSFDVKWANRRFMILAKVTHFLDQKIQ